MKKKYEEMTRAERRVAIATDVIKAVNGGVFSRIECGNYVFPAIGEESIVLDTLLSKSNAKDLAAKCEVCARGAMMFTKIAKYNGCEVELFAGSSATTKALKDAFSTKQLGLIEAAFERNPRFAEREYCDTPKEAWDAAAFGWSFDNPEDRLIAIMQNIVDHDGTFKPSVRYEMVTK